jgi:hypothetical protein
VVEEAGLRLKTEDSGSLPKNSRTCIAGFCAETAERAGLPMAQELQNVL